MPSVITANAKGTLDLNDCSLHNRHLDQVHFDVHSHTEATMSNPTTPSSSDHHAATDSMECEPVIQSVQDVAAVDDSYDVSSCRQPVIPVPVSSMTNLRGSARLSSKPHTTYNHAQAHLRCGGCDD
jgi:hypothetical protein